MTYTQFKLFVVALAFWTLAALLRVGDVLHPALAAARANYTIGGLK